MAKKAQEYALFPFEESFWNLIFHLSLGSAKITENSTKYCN